METSIELIQKPQIKHALQEAGANVTRRINELNLDKLIATDDTIKSMKELRADLNKEATEFETQRKAIKSAILNPYDEFEAIYNYEIKEKYTNAVNLLKDKIGAFETKVKDEKKKTVETYFNELCVAEKIDFVKFETVISEINLSTSEKKYKELCNEFIMKVVDDINLINAQEHSALILVEYKATLNASKSITTVVDRISKEKQELERKQQAEIQRRKRVLGDLGFVFMDITNAFEYDSEIYIKDDDIVKLPTTEFNTKVAEFEAKINDKKAQALKAKQESESKIDKPTETPTDHTQTPEPAQPLQAPTVEVKEEIFKAKFEVTGTRAQLLALKAYLLENKITYANIK